MDHLNVLRRHEVVNHKVLQLQLLLEDAATFLQRLDLLRIHLLQLLILVLQVFQPAQFLLNLQRLVLIFFLQRLVHLVSVVHNVLLLFQVLLDLALVLSLPLQLLQLSFQLVRLVQRRLFLLVTVQHLLLHLFQLLD
jgi:hypothetical protein